MSTPEAPLEPQSESPEEETYCYAHPKTPTRLKCSRCGRPICGRCAIPASVGQHCPECVAEARRAAPKVRSAMRATAPITMAILIINVAVWAIQSFFYQDLTPLAAAFPPAIAQGEYYRLVTAMFLHQPVAFWHIGLNSYALFLFGPNIEQGFGKARFLAIYLLAGLMGSAFSYTFGSCRPSVGASGAIFGLLGALLVYLFNRRQQTFVRGYIRNILFLIVINLVIGYVFPNIDNLAHLGGLTGGMLMAMGLDDRGTAKTALGRAALIAGVVLPFVLIVWRTTNFSC